MKYQNQSTYWDKLADEKVFTHPVDFHELSKYVNKKSSILDYGCGYGRTCNELKGHGYKNIVGVDISDAMIRRGKRTFPDLNLLKMNEFNFETSKEKFDCTILFSVLNCIPDEQEQLAVVNQLKDVLRPGGLLYISDLIVQIDERNVERYKKFADKYGKYGIFETSDGGVFRHFEIEEIEQLTSNFDQVQLKYIKIVTMNGNPAVGFQYFGVKKS